MSTRPWRGTLIYVGAAATIAAAGIGRFGTAPTQATAASQSSGTTAAQGATGTSTAPSTSSGATSTGSGSTTATVTIVGKVEQNRYGNVQVSVTFTGSQITAVQTLQSPNRDGRSQEIASYSTPILAQEVVAAQSAKIDTISGATYTSESYMQSVQSAIDQHH